jgi:hypothetical protein
MLGTIQWDSARAMLAHYSDVRRKFFPVVMRQPARPKPAEPEPVEPEPPEEAAPLPTIAMQPPPSMVPENASLETRIETAISLSLAMFGRRPTINKVLIVMESVAQCFDVPVSKLIGPERLRYIVLPRQIVCAIVRRITNCSYPEIGRRMNRDHTTSIFGARKYAALVDAAFNRRNENDIPAR